MFKILRKILIVLIISIIIVPSFASAQKDNSLKFWDIQSIDTAKYSRDLARERLRDSSFDRIIDEQVSDIAKTGATHIAVATPYDSEFSPFLRRWVESARRNGLNVWFRGNWSGWEGWFDYDRIDRLQHIGRTYDFIVLNKNLFEDGDIFTACPECENGGPGDPRFNGDLKGHRQFLIDEHEAMENAFNRIDKDVIFNFNSMNGDVAFLVMDEKTTEALGGIITIDHYVKDKNKLISDINKLAQQGGEAKIVLGEFGAPIPDIHGRMSPIDQAKWIQDFLVDLAKIDEVVGVNYWTNVGGSTQIWETDLTPKPAVKVINDFYEPSYIVGYIVDELSWPIKGTVVSNDYASIITEENGMFILPHVDYFDLMLAVEKDGFIKIEKLFEDYNGEQIEVILKRAKFSFSFNILKMLKQLGSVFSIFFQIF